MSDWARLTAPAVAPAPATKVRQRAGAEPLAVVLLVVLAVAVLWWRWVGYQGHDDASYATSAQAWLDHFPTVGNNHWALRYTLVLPIAAGLALAGPVVAALAVPNLLGFAAMLAVSYLAMRRWFGWPAAFILCGIYALLPEFPVQATYANPDLLETAFVVLSFWALMAARAHGQVGRNALGWMFVSGLLAGLGFLTRETTLALLVLFGLLFLFRPGVKRWHYVVAGLGFVLLIGAQSAWFQVQTGDPLYRYRLSATHDHVDRAAKTEAAEAAGDALDSEGVLAVRPVLAPFSAVLVSQKFGFLFWLAVPAYLLLLRRRPADPVSRSVLHCAALGGLVLFLFVAANAEILYVVPRYFASAAALAAVPVAVLAASWLAAGGALRVLSVLVLAGLAVSSAALLYLENTQPLHAEQRIIDYAITSGEAVHMDPETARRAGFLLLARNVGDHVVKTAPGPGQFVGSEDGAVSGCLRDPACYAFDRMKAFAPGPGWTEVARIEPPVRAVAPLLEALGVKQRLPPDIWRRVVQPGSDALIYRTPAS